MPWFWVSGFLALSIVGVPFPISQGFPAQLPDDACGPVPAVELRIGAGPARCQALLAVSPLVLTTEELGLGIGVVAAGPCLLHGFTQGSSSVVMTVREKCISRKCLNCS